MKSYVVIGCGRFGTAVAKTLIELGNEVMVIDSDEDIIREVGKWVTVAAEADVSDKDTLINLGIGNCDTAIISIGSSIEPSIIATITAKELGIKSVVAKAKNDIHATILKKIGADIVIFPERDMGERIARKLSGRNVIDYIELSDDYSIVELKVQDKWAGKSLSELKLPNRYGINLIAIKSGKNFNTLPSADTVINISDTLIAAGATETLNKFQ